MTDSHTLLSLYARTGSESAFRELVSRYIDLVYSTAFRLVGGDAQWAQDVAQAVFVALAAKARTLPKDVMLGGWLHQHTRFVAGELMRTERRRQLRERQAAEMNAIEDHSESNLAQVVPVLDEAIGELDAEDRTAILLRFFERKDYRSVGEALGSSEDAARKRVDRALEKLHVLLRHRGATLSAAALGTALASEAVTAAPSGLATTISAAALTGTTLATATTATAAKAITMPTLQKTVTTFVLAATAGTGIYEARQAASARAEVQTLQQRQGPLVEQIQQLQRDRDDTARQFASLREENERLNRNTAELLRLRGELAVLRNTAQNSKQAETDSILNSAKSLLERVNVLKQWIEQRPDEQIPEFQYLHDYDWIDAVKSSNMLGENAARNAMRGLREAAKNQFAHELSNALRRFVQEHNGDLPTALSELNAYFQQPMNDAILKSYKLLHSGKLADLPKNEPIVGEIVPPFDAQDSTSLLIGIDGWRKALRDN